MNEEHSHKNEISKESSSKNISTGKEHAGVTIPMELCLNIGSPGVFCTLRSRLVECPYVVALCHVSDSKSLIASGCRFFCRESQFQRLPTHFKWHFGGYSHAAQVGRPFYVEFGLLLGLPVWKKWKRKRIRHEKWGSWCSLLFSRQFHTLGALKSIFSTCQALSKADSNKDLLTSEAIIQAGRYMKSEKSSIFRSQHERENENWITLSVWNASN